MHKKLIKMLSAIIISCLLIPTAVHAEETLQNMTYEEYLERQESADSEVSSSRDMSPVHVADTEPAAMTKSEEARSYINESKEMQELGTVASEHINLPNSIDKTRTAELSVNELSVNKNTISGNVPDDKGVMAAPIAGLIPIIVNEETLVNGDISTETWIAFFFNDSDEDGDAIVNRYVGGSAVDYIIGEVEGGFVINITAAGTYDLLYQVEDSSGSFSKITGYTIDVVERPADTGYQVFEGSFSSADDSATYNFSIDFTQMDSAAVCLVRKGYVGTSIKVYDEAGNEVVYRGTQMGQPKNWQYIDKPSADAGICNYTVVATPKAGEYGNGASDYRIIIGDKKETELMMSGIENTVLLEHYREGESRVENAHYLPNAGEYWYKFRANNEVITVLSDTSNLRFKIKAINNLTDDLFDSANESRTHKTSFTGSSWTCAEKARLNTTVGTEYYLVVYCTTPNQNITLREGSMGTAVGYPVMLADSTKIYPNRSVTMNSTGYSSISFGINESSSIPATGQVVDMNLYGIAMSNVDRWRLSAPNQSFWVNNKSSHYPAVDMNYRHNVSTNAKLTGTWQAAFKASSSAGTKTFTPYFFVSYYCEYGDD